MTLIFYIKVDVEEEEEEEEENFKLSLDPIILFSSIKDLTFNL